MKRTTSLFVVLALSVATAGFFGCSEDDGGNGPGPGTSPTIAFEFVSVTQTESGYELGVDLSTTDDAGITGIEIYVDDQTIPATTISSAPWVALLPISLTDEGGHTVSAKGYDSEGKETNVVTETFSKYMRGVLTEIITSANCTNCAPANEAFAQAVETIVAKRRIISIKYHVWWPLPTDSLYHLTKTWSRPRTEFVFAPSPPTAAPNAFIDGANIGASPANWFAQALARINQNPRVQFDIAKTDNGSSVDLEIKAEGVLIGSLDDLRLHTVVTESEIHYNDGNAEDVHHDVMKEMLPDDAGESITLPDGVTNTYNRTITIPAGSIKDNMHVVIFVQRETSKEILQAVKIDL